MSEGHRETRNVIARNWHPLLSWIFIIAGAIHTLGFQAAKIVAQREEIVALKGQVTEITAGQQALRDHVSRLQWDRDAINKTVSEIQLDVRSLLRSMLEQENRSKVIVDLLKPKQIQ